jgi:hypothetical protein
LDGKRSTRGSSGGSSISSADVRFGFVFHEAPVFQVCVEMNFLPHGEPQNHPGAVGLLLHHSEMQLLKGLFVISQRDSGLDFVGWKRNRERDPLSKMTVVNLL